MIVSGGYGSNISGITNSNGYFSVSIKPTNVGGPFTLNYSVTSSSGNMKINQNTLKVTAPITVPTDKVLEGTVIAGQMGTMPNNGDLSAKITTGDKITIPAGYTTGGTITASTTLVAGDSVWVNLPEGDAHWIRSSDFVKVYSVTVQNSGTVRIKLQTRLYLSAINSWGGGSCQIVKNGKVVRSYYIDVASDTITYDLAVEAGDTIGIYACPYGQFQEIMISNFQLCLASSSAGYVVNYGN